MNSIAMNTWHAEGLRWLASLLTSAADRLDRSVAPRYYVDGSHNDPVASGHELHFDSDIYLAQVKDRAYRYL